jgi:uracil DNA glycosylase
MNSSAASVQDTYSSGAVTRILTVVVMLGQDTYSSGASVQDTYSSGAVTRILTVVVMLGQDTYSSDVLIRTALVLWASILTAVVMLGQDTYSSGAVTRILTAVVQWSRMWQTTAVLYVGGQGQVPSISVILVRQ